MADLICGYKKLSSYAMFTKCTGVKTEGRKGQCVLVWVPSWFYEQKPNLFVYSCFKMVVKCRVYGMLLCYNSTTEK